MCETATSTEGETLLGRDMVERIRNRLAIRGILLLEEVDVPAEVFSDCQSRQLKGILEELVSNVLKHSQAESVRIECRDRLGMSFFLDFSDDGQGIRTLNDENCFGLSNINKRIEYLGGRCERSSFPEEGVCFHITVPLNRCEEKS